jgi:hypothetical protein
VKPKLFVTFSPCPTKAKIKTSADKTPERDNFMVCINSRNLPFNSALGEFYSPMDGQPQECGKSPSFFSRNRGDEIREVNGRPP